MMTKTTTTGNEVDVDGDGAMGNNNQDDDDGGGDDAMGSGTTGYDDDVDDDGVTTTTTTKRWRDDDNDDDDGNGAMGDGRRDTTTTVKMMAADGKDNEGGWSCAFVSGRSSCSTACDDKIGPRTTTQQPTNERRCSGGGSATVRGRRQLGDAMPKRRRLPGRWYCSTMGRSIRMTERQGFEIFVSFILTRSA